MRIFIADDDADDLEIFQMAMKELHPDAEIIEAENGQILCENLQNRTPPMPDIIFIDINMPKINGYDCIKLIRSNPVYADLPVVVLSTSLVPADIDSMYEHGANCYITKPVKFGDFKRVLATVINHPCPYEKRSKETFHVSNLTH